MDLTNGSHYLLCRKKWDASYHRDKDDMRDDLNVHFYWTFISLRGWLCQVCMKIFGVL